MSILQIDRAEFLAHRWAYKPGEHVTFLGKTGSGKTTLKMQLLHATEAGFPERGKIAIVDTKPRNIEVDNWAKRFGWAITPTWPPGPKTRALQLLAERKTKAFVFRPPHSGNLEQTDHLIGRAVLRLGMTAYRSKNPWILDSDEMLDWVDINDPKHGVHLEKFMRVAWTRGRSMECGFWAGTQRPYDVPLYAYSQPTHLFLAREVDQNNLKRLRTIGGIDPVEIGVVLVNLPKFHWLYLRPTEGQACIIGS